MKVIKDLTLIAIFAAVIVVSELVLYFLPNIQITFLLIVLFSKILGFKKTSLLLLIYVLIDNLIMGGITLYVPFVYVALLIIPLTLNTVFKSIDDPFKLALLGILYSFIYSWIYLIATVILTNIDFIAYLTADIIFEILLAGSTFLSILWLYNPLYKFLNNRLNESKY